MKVEFRIVKKVWISLGLALLIVCGLQSTAKAQALEKVLITHSSDSVSITPLLCGTGAAATRASLRAIGVDPDREVTLIVIGAASVRMAAMEAGSVEAAIMPVPWNIRMKQKGFKELIFAGKVMSQPLTGLASSKDKAEKNPEQLKKMLRGFFRTLRAVREDKKGVTEFIAKKSPEDADAADETYRIMLQTMSGDGMVSEADLKDLLEQAKHETGAKRDIALKEIVDYSLLRQVTRETER